MVLPVAARPGCSPANRGCLTLATPEREISLAEIGKKIMLVTTWPNNVTLEYAGFQYYSTVRSTSTCIRVLYDGAPTHVRTARPTNFLGPLLTWSTLRVPRLIVVARLLHQSIRVASIVRRSLILIYDIPCRGSSVMLPCQD